MKTSDQVGVFSLLFYEGVAMKLHWYNKYLNLLL